MIWKMWCTVYLKYVDIDTVLPTVFRFIERNIFFYRSIYLLMRKLQRIYYFMCNSQCVRYKKFTMKTITAVEHENYIALFHFSYHTGTNSMLWNLCHDSKYLMTREKWSLHLILPVQKCSPQIFVFTVKSVKSIPDQSKWPMDGDKKKRKLSNAPTAFTQFKQKN